MRIILKLVNIIFVAVGIDDTSILREATVPILTNEQCGTFYSGYNTIYDVHLCAGYDLCLLAIT